MPAAGWGIPGPVCRRRRRRLLARVGWVAGGELENQRRRLEAERAQDRLLLGSQRGAFGTFAGRAGEGTDMQWSSSSRRSRHISLVWVSAIGAKQAFCSGAATDASYFRFS